MSFTVEWFHLAYVAIAPLVVLFAIWYAKNFRRIPDYVNLFFRRSKVVHVEFRTLANRTIDRFVVPDARNIMKIDGGAYLYDKDSISWDSKYRVPRVTVVQSQVSSPMAGIVVAEHETEVEIPAGDGGMTKTKMKVPTYILNFARHRPEKLKGHTAEEIFDVLNTKIVNDIVNATSSNMRQLQYTFYAAIAILVLLVIGLVALAVQIDQLGGQLSIIRALLAGK